MSRGYDAGLAGASPVRGDTSKLVEVTLVTRATTGVELLLYSTEQTTTGLTWVFARFAVTAVPPTVTVPASSWAASPGSHASVVSLQISPPVHGSPAESQSFTALQNSVPLQNSPSSGQLASFSHTVVHATHYMLNTYLWVAPNGGSRRPHGAALLFSAGYEG